MSGKGVDTKFLLLPDDTELIADGADSTRVVLRVTDEFGAIRPFANDAIKFELEGPAEMIGDNPFSLIGGTGAVWIRAQEQAGKVTLKAIHPSLGSQRDRDQDSSRTGRNCLTDGILTDSQLPLNLLQRHAFRLRHHRLHPDQLQNHHAGEEEKDIARRERVHHLREEVWSAAQRRSSG